MQKITTLSVFFSVRAHYESLNPVLQNDPTEVRGTASAPHFIRIYMRALNTYQWNWSQKTVVSFYDSLIFFNIHWLSCPFHPQKVFLFELLGSSVAVCITQARIIRPSFLRHAAWAHAKLQSHGNLSATWHIEKSTNKCYSNLTWRGSSLTFKILIRSKGAMRHSGQNLLQEIFTQLPLHQSLQLLFD